MFTGLLSLSLVAHSPRNTSMDAQNACQVLLHIREHRKWLCLASDTTIADKNNSLDQCGLDEEKSRKWLSVYAVYRSAFMYSSVCDWDLRKLNLGQCTDCNDSESRVCPVSVFVCVDFCELGQIRPWGPCYVCSVISCHQFCLPSSHIWHFGSQGSEKRHSSH